MLAADQVRFTPEDEVIDPHRGEPDPGLPVRIRSL
jgi:hypothetical protein